MGKWTNECVCKKIYGPINLEPERGYQRLVNGNIVQCVREWKRRSYSIRKGIKIPAALEWDHSPANSMRMKEGIPTHFEWDNG